MRGQDADTRDRARGHSGAAWHHRLDAVAPGVADAAPVVPGRERVAVLPARFGLRPAGVVVRCLQQRRRDHAGRLPQLLGRRGPHFDHEGMVSRRGLRRRGRLRQAPIMRSAATPAPAARPSNRGSASSAWRRRSMSRWRVPTRPTPETRPTGSHLGADVLDFENLRARWRVENLRAQMWEARRVRRRGGRGRRCRSTGGAACSSRGPRSGGSAPGSG